MLRRMPRLVLVSMLCGLVFPGCATIMHGRNQEITFETTPPGAVVTVESTGAVRRGAGVTPFTLNLKRKYRYLISIRKPGYEPASAILKQRTSNWLYGNIAFWSAPGFLADIVGGGMYNLDPQAVHVTLTESPGTDTDLDYAKVLAPRPRLRRSRRYNGAIDNSKLRLTLSLPEGNWFYYDHSETFVNRFGFLGLVVGLEYGPRRNRFYSLRFGFTTDFVLPIPVHVDFFCGFEGSLETVFLLQFNQNFAEYAVGGGLHWLQLSYHRTVYESSDCRARFPEIEDYQDYDIHLQSLGPSFTVQRRMGVDWYVDLNYLPTILMIEDGRFRLRYSHTIYFGITYKLKLLSMNPRRVRD